MKEEFNQPYEYEVDLRDYINVIWKQKWLIVAVTVLAVLLAGGYSFRQPDTYETQATLMITPRVSEQIVETKGDSGIGVVSLPSSAYERAALAADLLDQIIQELELKDGEGKLISVGALKGKMDIDVETQPRDGVNGGTFEVPLVTMTVRSGDPDKAESIANKWAELFQQRTAEIFSSETARSYQFISGRFKEVKEELNSLEEERQAYLEESSLESLESETSVLKKQYTRSLTRLEEKQADLKGKKAELAQIENALDVEPKFLEPQRSVSKEAIWEFLAGGIDEDQLAALPELKVTDQVVNDLHYGLKEEFTEVGASVAALEEQISYLEKRVETLKVGLEETQAKINKVNLTKERLDREINRLRNTYKTLSSNLEEARLANEEKESSVRIMEKAVSPEKPLSTNTKQNVAVAGVLGLFIGILAAFFKNYMKGYEEEEETGEDEKEKDEEMAEE